MGWDADVSLSPVVSVGLGQRLRGGGCGSCCLQWFPPSRLTEDRGSPITGWVLPLFSTPICSFPPSQIGKARAWMQSGGETWLKAVGEGGEAEIPCASSDVSAGLGTGDLNLGVVVLPALPPSSCWW